MKMKRILMIFAVLMLAVYLVGCSSESNTSSENNTSNNGEENDDGSKSTGGELRVAYDAQPPTIDPHMSTAVATKHVARHIVETLYALNEDYKPVPELAESVDISEDGKTYTFKLRQGVKFHNGKEMTSEDVVASLNRWFELSTAANSAFEGATLEATDDYTVVLKLKEPRADTLDLIATHKQYAGIMPKESIESADVDGIEEVIGTGPFKFEEWKQDQYIHLTKYEDYQPVDSEPSGLSGKKEALVDDLYFEIVTDPSTRVAGIQTGQYDAVVGVPPDNYEQLKSNSQIKTYTEPYGNQLLVYNKKQGISSDPKIRQALNAAIDNEKVMKAALSMDDLYTLNPGFLGKSLKSWYSDAGKEAFNQADPDKAQKLAEEAGYNGEELTLMVTRDYADHYNSGVVIKEQLEQAGFKVKLEVYDWATLLDKRTNPEEWDMFITGSSSVTTPSQLISLNPTWPGWTDDPKITKLMNEIATATSQDVAKQKWDELHEFLWTEYVPVTIIGQKMDIHATTDKVEGFTTLAGPIYWNTSVSK